MAVERQQTLPTVSIITPNYNYGHFIIETIESILEQDYPYIEYIVVDGGSTDNSLEVIQSYGTCVRLIRQQSSGQSAAINEGLRASSGQIVTFLNSDDLLEDSNSITLGVEALLNNPDAIMLYGDAREIDERSRTLSYVKSSWDEFDLEQSFSRLFNPVPQPSSLMWRRALELVGYYNEQLHIAMDWEYWLRLATVGRIIHIPHCLSRMRMHGSSKTVRELRARVDAIQAIYRDAFAGDWLPESCRKKEQEIRFIVACYCLMLCMSVGDLPMGWTMFKQAMAHGFRSNKRTLVRLLGQSLQSRRWVTFSRYFSMVRSS